MELHPISNHFDLIFHIVDVFAEKRYAGNQLAVFRGASQLSTSLMQKIARETNYSETTFITSADDAKSNSFNVRIFTPNHEIPFAGHPTIGTAFVIRNFIIGSKVFAITLQLGVGPITVTPIYDSNGKVDSLWMRHNEPVFNAAEFERGKIAKTLGIEESGIDDRYPIQEVSTGLPFIIVPLKDLKTLKSCNLQSDQYFDLIRKTESKSVLVYSPEAYVKGHDLSVRVFVKHYGPVEDPATGSGNGCLAAYLSRYKCLGRSSIDVIADQGYEIGRPSALYLKTSPSRGKMNVSVGGRVIPIAEGHWT